MKKEVLYNKKGRGILEDELMSEKFERVTASFYRYYTLSDPEALRDNLFLKLNALKILGRIYVSKEGINAQFSVPEHYWDQFLDTLDNIQGLDKVKIKIALQGGRSFLKLTIKVRDELVAYGVPEGSYDMRNVGKHLSAQEYNFAMDHPDTIVVDMRNYYESEIGRFDGAIIPDVEKSKDLLQQVKQKLEGKEERHILLYCTGGIRCEKASSYLIKQGFENVNQLQGGIIQYAHEIKEKGLPSKFKGKNFVFDERLGERVTDDILANCHICSYPCDTHTDCKNDACHILFIQCNNCAKTLNGCCSKDCQDFAALPIEEQKKLRKQPDNVVSKTFFDSRIKPKLKSLI